MQGTLLESTNQANEPRSGGLIFVGMICAVVITALLIAGYFYVRKRHVQQTLIAAALEQPPAPGPKAPARAQILVDQALIKADQTLLGGTVRNISNDTLSDLSVDLELRRRKDGTPQKTSVQLQPADLGPQQEGHYALQVRSADYSSARVVGLRSGATSSPIAFSQGLGQKRPPERLESKTLIVNRPAPSKDGFLNTPDNPGRVP